MLAAARNLPRPSRERFDADRRDVHDLATEDGTRALVAEADAAGVSLPPAFHELAGAAARGMWFLAHHPDAFHAARLVYAADHLAARSCATVTGVPNVLPDHTPEALTPSAGRSPSIPSGRPAAGGATSTHSFAGPADAPARQHPAVGRVVEPLGRLARTRPGGWSPAGPVRIGGSKKWRRADIESWVAAGSPDRDTWARMKKAK